MAVKLYNTLTREVDEVIPVEDNRVKLYTCGLTVYSQPHIGNWVAYIYWDILVRVLKESGHDVTRVQNITDVGHLTSDEDAGEDKMLKGALKEGLTAWQVAEKYITIADNEAYTQLNLVRPDHMPRATDYIPQQITFVEELERKGYTYVLEDGVYFDTSKLEDYGKLARLDIAGLQFGARVADTGKKNPTDFAVWKFSNPDEKRDMEWESPWGTGFPGWHLECSVMAREILGDQIDIHTGGIDHIPVHHTNEIAQTEAVTGKKFSKLWVHANHMKINGKKMSKSLGNIYTLADIVERGYDLRAFKLLVLSKHYRTEGNFTWEILDAFQNNIKNWQAWADLRFQNLSSRNLEINYNEAKKIILGHLQDDLDTVHAVGYINGMINRIEQLGIDSEAISSAAMFIGDTVGINLMNSKDISNELKALIADRQKAREAKDWAESDKLRDELLKQGITVKDTPNGSIWQRS